MSSQGYGIHFFKVILESTFQKGELKVPTSFARKHWKGMRNPVILSLPNGFKQKVYWMKRDCGVWFCNGWKEFAKHSHLGVSHIVVFRYQGNSSFNVIIFGKSSMEIEYPSSKGTTTCEEVKEIEDSDGDVEFVEEHTPIGNERPKFPSSYSTTINTKISPKEEDDEPMHWKKKTGLQNSNHINSGSSSKGVFKKRIKLFHNDVKRIFNSEYEHFICLIQKTYIERELLIIPVEFSKSYLHKENGMLFVDNGRTWDVEVKVNSYGQLTFSNGWRKFLLDNKLKVGDVCVFELQNIEDFSFKVTIYPFVEDPTTLLFLGQETPVTPKDCNTSNPKKEDIHICINSSILPTIPFRYIRRYVTENGRYATLCVGNRSWKVKVLCYDKNSFARFSSGWMKFARECDFKEGEVCTLRIIDVKNLVFEVSG